MRRGFNLIEALVAVAILAAVFLPVFTVFRSGVTTTKYSEDRLRALNIAVQQTEAIRHAANINKNSLDLVVRQHLISGGFQPYTVDERYRVSTDVDPDFVVDEGGTQAFVTRVMVRVDWNLGQTPRSLNVETYVDRAYE